MFGQLMKFLFWGYTRNSEKQQLCLNKLEAIRLINTLTSLSNSDRRDTYGGKIAKG